MNPFHRLLSQIISDAARRPSSEPADKWVERNIVLGGDSDLQGRVSFDLIPMARFLLRKCQDPRVRSITAMISTQSAKTKTIEFFLMWKIKNSPAPTGWYMDTQESAKLFAQTRVIQDLESAELIAPLLPKDRNKKKWSLIQMSVMDFYVLGANTKRNRERISLETVICDERRNFPRGAMQSIRNRYKTFRNHKEISISSAGDEFDDLHAGYLQGTQHLFYWRCLDCDHPQPFRFGRDETTLFPTKRERGGIIWDDNERTHPGEHVWNTDELRKTVRYQCEVCGRLYGNHEKQLLLATMTEENNFGAVQMNPMASPEHVSLHWNELYMPWAECSWERTAEKFIKARMAQTLNNDIEPLKVFVKESLGEPWRLFSEKPEPDEILALRSDYSFGQCYDPKLVPITVKILSVDVQQDFLVIVLREWEWGGSGSSRLIFAGTLLGFGELREFQTQNGLKAKLTFIDCAYYRRQKEVFKFCLQYGSHPILGSDAKEFVQSFRTDETTKERQAVKTFWKEDTIDPEEGRSQQGRLFLKRFSWSNTHYKNLFCFYVLKGKAGRWTLPMDIAEKCPEYLRQLPGHRRITHTSPDGIVSYEWADEKPNDYADCELMQLAAADICAVTKSTSEKGKQ
jgi:hypothetical protein